VDRRRLGFFGHSAGAYQGAILAGVEPRLRAVVLASAGSGTPLRLARQRLPDLPAADLAAYLDFLGQFDPAAYAAEPGQRRLMIQHGRDDHIVSRAEALALRDAAAPPCTWREYPCGHGTDAFAPARRDRADFLAEALAVGGDHEAAGDES
jgi:fermentation-respiration switch protein FrsA (DUF1100 family)